MTVQESSVMNVAKTPGSPARQGSVDSYADYSSTEEILDPLTPATCNNTNLLAEVSSDIITDLLLLRRNDSCYDTLVGQNLLISLPPAGVDKGGENLVKELFKNCSEEFRGRQIFETSAHPCGLSEFVSNQINNNVNNVSNIVVVSGGTSRLMINRNRRLFLNHMMQSIIEANEAFQSQCGQVIQKVAAADTILGLLGSKFTQNRLHSTMLRHIDIHNNVASQPVGATFTALLFDHAICSLEQSNFAIFYLLVNQGPPKIKTSLFMDPGKASKDYTLLKTNARIELETDFSRFGDLLDLLEIEGDTQLEFWKVIASIIHLGQVEFAIQDGKMSVDPSHQERLENFCKLLDLKLSDVQDLFADKSKEQAEKLKIVLISATYGKFFKSFVFYINKIMVVTQSKLQYGHLCNVSLVDSPVGFTQQNESLPALESNFLQDLYIHLMNEILLLKKQELYIEDCLNWTPVNYNCPRDRLKLVGLGDPSILTFLSRESSKDMESQSKSQDLVKQIVDTFFDNEHLKKKTAGIKDVPKNDSRDSDLLSNYGTQFTVSHVFGEVVYSAEEIMSALKTVSFETQDKLRGIFGESSHMFIDQREQDQFHYQSASFVMKFEHLEAVQKYADYLLKLSSQKTQGYFLYGIHPTRKTDRNDSNVKFLTMTLRAMNVSPLTQISQRGYVLSMGYASFLRRYKMLTQYTWPMFNGRSDLHGILLMLYILGLNDTCDLGSRMIHVQSIETLAQLEHMRTTMLPAVIKFLQKMWRGAIARQRYKIFYAMFKIVRKFRAWKFKIYLLTLIRRFSGVREMADFGKSLEWPEAPFILRKFHIKLYNTFRRWRLRQRLKSITSEEWPEIKCKIAALDVIGRKRDLVLNRRWEGNYLADTKENTHAAVYLTSMNAILTRNQSGSVIFSSFIRKMSSRGKTVERAIVFTEYTIFKLDPRRDFKLLKSIELEEIYEIVVTDGEDQLVVLRTTDNYDIAITLENNKNENRVPELIGALRLNAKVQQKKKTRPIEYGHRASIDIHEPLEFLKFSVMKPPIECMINSSKHSIHVEVLEAKQSAEEIRKEKEKDNLLANSITDARFRKESGSKKIIMEYLAPPAKKVAGKLAKNTEAKQGNQKTAQKGISLEDKKVNVIKVQEVEEKPDTPLIGSASTESTKL